ncbi:MAG TPA: organomercurial lyase [Bryobacteraceae bacterium]|nr:organomercurial lyase [Bryobacteraceae bacterium]
MADDPTLSRLHHALIRGLIDRGACPANLELASALGLTESELEGQLRDLADIHGIVLDPRACEPWIVHPFSLTPTIHWIEGASHSWWAPCVWCALGVASVAGGDLRIHTRFGAEAETLVIDVAYGRLKAGPEVWVHFAIPPARAWDNVHRHCSLVLPFHSAAEIQDWCGRHGVAFGEAVPLDRVAHLARVWYGAYGDPGWKKWTVAEARKIFTRVGLVSDFWRLEQRAGNF